MKILQSAVFATVLLMVTTTQSFGSFKTAKQLLDNCLATEPSKSGQCIGYVEAIADVALCGIGVAGYYSSIPKNATNGQSVKIVINWLD
jgi:hypothetical protein